MQKKIINKGVNLVQKRTNKMFFGRPYWMMDLLPQGIKGSFNK